MDAAGRHQTKLFILVVLAFIPAVGLYVYAMGAARAAAEREREQELLQFVRVTAVEYQRMLQGSEVLLASLAEFPEVREGGETCTERLSAVLRHAPQYTTFSQIGMDGYMACGAITVDAPLYLGDRAYFRNAVASGRFAVGTYAIGRITGKPMIGVALPLLDGPDGEVQWVFAASLDLTVLANQASRLRIPDGASLTLLDQNRRIMLRFPEGVAAQGADTVGAQAPETFPGLGGGTGEPYIESGVDLDGAPTRFAVAPLGTGGSGAHGHLIVGVEEASLADSVDAVSGRALRFLAGAGILLLIVAWAFGHWALVRPEPVGTSGV